jgi:short-subunit dehydrogenase
MPTAMITGASSGLGWEMSRVFAKHQYDLILVSRREEVLLSLAKELMREYAVTVHVFASDLSQPAAAENINRHVQDQGLVVDVLINNAGLGEYGNFSEASLEKITEMVMVNLHALTLLTRLLLPGMLARRNGKVLNVASTVAFQPQPLLAVYAATKAYVLSFSRALSLELKGSGIVVTALCPGSTRSDFFRRASMHHVTKKEIGRFANPSLVADFGYESLLNGKRTAIFGLGNRIRISVLRFFPDSWAGWLIVLRRGRTEP